jgi:hypothetical protein
MALDRRADVEPVQLLRLDERFEIEVGVDPVLSGHLSCAILVYITDRQQLGLGALIES